MKLHNTAVIALLYLCLLSSCQEKHAEDQIQTLAQNSKIVNGELTNQLKSPFTSVVGLFDLKHGYLCTGTLIASSTVLTAGHCVVGDGKSLVVVFAPDVYKEIDFDQNPATNPKLRAALWGQVHPDYVGGDSDQEFNQSDLALVYFDGTLPEGFKPAKLDTLSPKIGDSILLSGFGVTHVEVNEINGHNTPHIDELLKEGSAICYDKKREECFIIKMSGDGQLRMAHAPIAHVYPTEFANDETKAGTCSGDSGGPAFRFQDGEYVLTGVTSRGPLLCNEDGVYTKVLSYLDWLNANSL